MLSCFTADLNVLKSKIEYNKNSLDVFYQNIQSDLQKEFCSLVSLKELFIIYEFLLTPDILDQINRLSTTFNENHLRLDREELKIPRTVNIVRDTNGSYKIFLETRKKLAGGDLNFNALELFGAVKSGTPGYSIDDQPFVKMASLKIELTDDNQSERIKQESELSSILSPHALKLFTGSVYQKKGSHKIGVWSEFVPMDLDRYLTLSQDKNSNLPLESDKVIKQLVMIVAKMHARGIVHQDLKPNNIYIRGDEVLLHDFEYGTFVEAPSVMTFGTHDYRSVELSFCDIAKGDYEDYMPPTYSKQLAREMFNDLDNAYNTLCDLGIYIASSKRDTKIFKEACDNLKRQLLCLRLENVSPVEDLNFEGMTEHALHEKLETLKSFLIAIKNERNQKRLSEYQQPHYSNDIWSLGIIIFELKYGHVPSYKESKRIAADPLLSQLLQPYREDRISAEAALQMISPVRFAIS